MNTVNNLQGQVRKTSRRMDIDKTNMCSHLQRKMFKPEGEYDEFYDDYVSGKKELSEINREYSAQFAGTGKED